MATMFEKIMASIAGMNKLDRTNDYFITKRNNEYILCKMDMKGFVQDIGFTNDISSLKKIVRQTYGDIYYKEYMIDEYDE